MFINYVDKGYILLFKDILMDLLHAFEIYPASHPFRRRDKQHGHCDKRQACRRNDPKPWHRFFHILAVMKRGGDF